MEMANLLDDFVIEAGEHVDVLESTLLHAQTLQSDPQALENVYRAAHSLKGMAGFFQLTPIVSLAHTLENILSALREGSLSLREGHIDILLQAVDCLREMVQTPGESHDAEVGGYLRALEDILRTPDGDAPRAPTPQSIPYDIPESIQKNLPTLTARGQKIYRLDFAFQGASGVYLHNPRLLFENIASVGKVLYAGCSLCESRDIDDIIAALEKGKGATLELLIASVLEKDLLVIALELPQEVIEPVAAAPAPPSIHEPAPAEPAPAPEADPPAEKARARGGKGSEVIRLGVGQVNQLMDLSGQLVLARNQLLSAMEAHRRSIPGLTGILQEISRITTELQDRVMLTRMQPVSTAFGRFPRVIRDLARKLDKELALEIEGEDISLDKMLIEALIDPLTHIIRNAAGHGIESAQERLAAGKPAVGTIRLDARMVNNLVTIEVIDDGRGIDLEAVRQKALEKALVTRRELDAMDEKETMALLFRSGLSTAGEVTDVSGRGIGMDVVRVNVEKLGGTVEIESQLGRGTLVRLRMPQTLAIVPSLIARVDGALCAIPQMYIEHIVRTGAQERSGAGRLGGAGLLCLDGRYLPAISLRDLHAAAGRQDWPRDGGAADIAVILRQDDLRFAMMIDAVLGLEETLAKPLPAPLRECTCYAGVTILGSGYAVPILDPGGMARMLALQPPQEAQAGEASSPEEAEAQETLVLFQCSGKEHYAVPLHEILRIETIDAERLQTIGADTYINIGEGTVRILRPEDYLPVRREAYGQRKLYALLPRRGEGRVGLLIRKIDAYERMPMRIDTTQFDHPCLLGTVQYSERILLLPRLEEMLRLADAGKRGGGA